MCKKEENGIFQIPKRYLTISLWMAPQGLLGLVFRNICWHIMCRMGWMDNVGLWVLEILLYDDFSISLTLYYIFWQRNKLQKIPFVVDSRHPLATIVTQMSLKSCVKQHIQIRSCNFIYKCPKENRIELYSHKWLLLQDIVHQVKWQNNLSIWTLRPLIFGTYFSAITSNQFN